MQAFHNTATPHLKDVWTKGAEALAVFVASQCKGVALADINKEIHR